MMKISKKIQEFIERSKSSDSYWAERLKLDFSMQMELRRKSKGLTYKDLAEKLGTSPAYITKIFKGDVNLTIDSIAKLAKTTGGRVHLNIVDENVQISSGAWLACIPKLGVANTAIHSTSSTTNVRARPELVYSNDRMAA